MKNYVCSLCEREAEPKVQFVGGSKHYSIPEGWTTHHVAGSEAGMTAYVFCPEDSKGFQAFVDHYRKFPVRVIEGMSIDG